MHKKPHSFTFLALFVFLFAQVCFAAVPQSQLQVVAELEQAKSCYETKDYGKAEQIYQSILKQYGDTDHALMAQKGLTILYIDWGKMPQADAAFEELVANFTRNAHIAEAVHEVAGHYRWLKKYEKSKQLCQYVIDNWPGSESAMWSQMGVAMANIALGEPNAAADAIDKLLTDFSRNEYIAQAVHEIAGHCSFLEKHEKARELHQYVLDNWPRSEQAMWSQMGVAVSNIALGKTEAAETAVDKLLTDFSKNGYIADAVRQAANAHRKSGNYEKADELYKYVIANWPGDESAVLARMDMALSNVASLINDGNDSEVQTAVNNLITDFNGNPDLPQSVFGIAETCYRKGLNVGVEQEAGNKVFLRKAVELLDGMAMQDISDSMFKASVFYVKGLSCRAAGDYAQAADAFQNAYQADPKHQYADYCLFARGYCYEVLLHNKLISEIQAKPIINLQYTKLLADCPRSQYAPYASDWLQSNQ
ncbi:MAG: tetratricopeptide repeat protein [Planctomycetes bacterium]|nr:tetratricopeptide repeat protein [Planctomycetota bacterium]MBU2458160.1 tetratricopeptide repeat protein [Planctomycetota bacterium]